jgi:hypothetical protein
VKAPELRLCRRQASTVPWTRNELRIGGLGPRISAASTARGKATPWRSPKWPRPSRRNIQFRMPPGELAAPLVASQLQLPVHQPVALEILVPRRPVRSIHQSTRIRSPVLEAARCVDSSNEMSPEKPNIFDPRPNAGPRDFLRIGCVLEEQEPVPG